MKPLAVVPDVSAGVVPADAVDDVDDVDNDHVPPLRAASEALTRVADFGTNPSGIEMYVYVPPRLAARPAVVVAIHYCTGSAQAYYADSPYARLADEKGFLVIFPSAPRPGACWDVSSPASLIRGGGGDSTAIANMVTYALQTYDADPGRVFVTGTSSGAMMTNVLAATYPDMFAAAVVYSGTPPGGFASATGDVAAWNAPCALGQIDRPPAVWAGIVADMYPGYAGVRPRMTVYHGSTDDILLAPNYRETIKAWCAVLACDPARPDRVQPDTPEPGYTTSSWAAGQLVGVYAEGVGHSVPIRGDDDMKAFGL